MEYTEQQVEIIVTQMLKKRPGGNRDFFGQTARYCLQDAHNFHQAIVDAVDCLDEPVGYECPKCYEDCSGECTASDSVKHIIRYM